MNINILFSVSVVITGILLSFAIDWRLGLNEFVVREEFIWWALGSLAVTITLYVYRRKK